MKIYMFSQHSYLGPWHGDSTFKKYMYFWDQRDYKLSFFKMLVDYSSIIEIVRHDILMDAFS